MSEPANTDLLERARAGDQDALGELLKGQNRLLEQMARKEVDGRLQVRLSAADIVQQTCLSAIRNFDDLRGKNERYRRRNHWTAVHRGTSLRIPPVGARCWTILPLS